MLRNSKNCRIAVVESNPPRYNPLAIFLNKYVKSAKNTKNKNRKKIIIGEIEKTESEKSLSGSTKKIVIPKQQRETIKSNK